MFHSAFVFLIVYLAKPYNYGLSLDCCPVVLVLAYIVNLAWPTRGGGVEVYCPGAQFCGRGPGNEVGVNVKEIV